MPTNLLIFMLVDCIIRVYSLLGLHVIDYSIRMFHKVIVSLDYFDLLSAILQKASCLMPLGTYYAKNYAGIIDLGLVFTNVKVFMQFNCFAKLCSHDSNIRDESLRQSCSIVDLRWLSTLLIILILLKFPIQQLIQIW